MDEKTKVLGEKLLHSIQETNRLLEIVAQPGRQVDQSNGPQGAGTSESGTTPRPLILGSREPSLEAKSKSRKRWEQVVKEWRPTIEFGAFCAAIVYAVITFFQWRDANGNFKQGQRAWVMVDEISIPHPFSSKEPTGIKFIAKNFGQSPALHFKSKTTMSYGGRGCEGTVAAPAPYDTESSMAPSAIEAWPNLAVSALPEGCITALESGAANFVLTSVFTYQDIFHRTHHTHVCTRYEGQTSRQLTTCEEGNDID